MTHFKVFLVVYMCLFVSLRKNPNCVCVIVSFLDSFLLPFFFYHCHSISHSGTMPTTLIWAHVAIPSQTQSCPLFPFQSPTVVEHCCYGSMGLPKSFTCLGVTFYTNVEQLIWVVRLWTHFTCQQTYVSISPPHTHQNNNIFLDYF